MSDKIKFIIIKDDGSIDTIFTCNNDYMNNMIEIGPGDDIDKIINYYKQNVNWICKDKVGSDNHIFYLQDYLKKHFNKEFSDMKIDPNKIQDDLLLYYLVSSLNNIVIVNSESHTDIAIIPKDEINEEQIKSLNKVVNLFDDDINWCVCDNMFLETIEEDNNKYKMLRYGDTKNGKLKDIVKLYNKDEDLKIK